ncbi:MAG TPA: hypothetical protein VLA19_13115 [Herpetosiphonaceae bacterium]|nr:hypothetical protein [Herpetosiphonaceae bacterium]
MATEPTGIGDEALGADTGFTPNFSVASPGSPADAMGTTPLPPSGGLGAADPGEDTSIAGDDQIHDPGIVQESPSSSAAALKPRLVDDVDPTHSNLSGPARTEEESGS